MDEDLLDPWAPPKPKSLFKNTMPVIEAAGAKVAATAALQPKLAVQKVAPPQEVTLTEEPAPPLQVIEYQAPELKGQNPDENFPIR